MILSRKTIVFALGLVLVLFLGIIVVLSQRGTKAPKVTQIIPSPLPERVPGQVVVKFKQSVSPSEIEASLRHYNAKIISTNDSIHTTLLQVPKGQEDAVIQKLTDDGLVEYAESNYIHHLRFIPNDPRFNQQWHLTMVQAPQAWEVTKGKGVKVAIIDTGVDKRHEDLSSQFAATNPSGITDSDGHGTHVSGIVGAMTNNAKGVAGVCPDCRLLVARDGGDNATAANSITWAVNQGAKVVSMSWGASSASNVLKDAVNYAFNKGALPVAAVPNELNNMANTPDYPSGMANVMSVTATDNTDRKATQFGAYGTNVWIASPGEDILSTMPGNRYEAISGTSMATPLVAGIAGLVWSTQYGTSPQAVRQRLCSTADRIAGTGSQFKCGRVNAAKAVGYVAPSPTRAPTQPPIGGGVPSPQCLGAACPTLVPTRAPVPTMVPSVPATAVPTQVATTPSTSAPTRQPTVQITQGSTSPTIDPCEDRNMRAGNTMQRKASGAGGLLQLLLDFFRLLFQMIQQLLGGALPPGSAPGPAPTEDPCDTMPSGDEPEPTDSINEPVATSAIEPTDTVAPTMVSPTQDPCSNRSLTSTGKRAAGGGGLLRLLLAFFLMIFQFMMQLLGGASVPAPAPLPNPGLEPTPPC